MNDLVKRSLTGAIFVLVVLAGILIHPVVFGLSFITFLVLTQIEFYRLVVRAGFSPQKISGTVLGGVLFFLCFACANHYIPWQFILLFFPILVVLLVFEIFQKKQNTLTNVSVTLAGFIYVAVPFSLLNFIVFPGFPTQSVFVPYILLGILFIIWVYDSFAYIFGSLFGKHKIAKNISPQKSWEGLIGGAVFAVIMGILNAVIFESQSMLSWIMFALIVVVFGTLGDFFESKIKRDLGAKDSGTLLPGHGGFLDRFDSLLFAIPVIYLWLILGGTF